MYWFLFIIIMILIAYIVRIKIFKREYPVISFCKHEDYNEIGTFEHPHRCRCIKCGEVFNRRRRE